MTLRISSQTRRVFHLSLPIFAELLLQLLVGNVDQFMLSGIGSEAVAAVGNGNQVMNVVIIVLETVSAATTILLTQHIGAGRTGEACDDIATVGVAVSGVFSLLMGLLLLLAPHLLFGLLRRAFERENRRRRAFHKAKVCIVHLGDAFQKMLLFFSAHGASSPFLAALGGG